MLASKVCIYCGVTLNTLHNDPHQRTVEHMIPNVALTIDRNNGEGDFHACKKCNGEKSRLDEVFGILCRMSGENKIGQADAANSFYKRIERNDTIFLKSFKNVTVKREGVLISIPVGVKDIYKYGTWLAKGQYFIENKKILKDDDFLISIDVIGFSEVEIIKEWYRKQHNSEAFDDLSQNGNIFNANKECFIICGKEARQMFVCFNRVFMFNIQLLDRTRQNETIHNKTRRALYNRLSR